MRAEPAATWPSVRRAFGETDWQWVTRMKVWTKEPTTVEGVRVEYLPFGTATDERPPGLHRHIRCNAGDFPWDRWERRAIASRVPAELAQLGKELMREASEHITWSDELYRECGWTDADGADGSEGDRMIARTLHDPDGARERWRHLLDTYGKRCGRRTMPWQDFLLQQYERDRPAYEQFGHLLVVLIKDHVAERNIRVHSVSARAKDAESLRWKLESKPGDCSDLSHITDLAGIRVITYFPDEVDAVAAVIRGEFDIDWANSIDKRTLLDPDRFGYSCLHYVLRLSQTRAQQTEFRQFAGFRGDPDTVHSPARLGRDRTRSGLQEPSRNTPTSQATFLSVGRPARIGRRRIPRHPRHVEELRIDFETATGNRPLFRHAG